MGIHVHVWGIHVHVWGIHVHVCEMNWDSITVVYIVYMEHTIYPEFFYNCGKLVF